MVKRLAWEPRDTIEMCPHCHEPTLHYCERMSEGFAIICEVCGKCNDFVYDDDVSENGMAKGDS